LSGSGCWQPDSHDSVDLSVCEDRIPTAVWIGFWFLAQLFDAGPVAHAQTSGVSWLAHVGGFMFRAAAAL
jgi:membrane associated rhomboid family serine protease